MSAYLFSILFDIFVILSCALECWLISRQKNCVLAHAAEVPDAFKGRVGKKDHAKAALYTTEKLRLRLLALIVTVALTFLMTHGGLAAALWNLFFGWTGVPLVSGLLLLAAATLINEAAELPVSWISQFRVEERFGFNRMTPKDWAMDVLKENGISLALLAVILTPILWLWERAGDWWWLWAWGVYVAVSLVLMVLYPVLIAPVFNKFTPMDDGPLKERLEALLARVGFQARGLYVMDGSRRSAHGNAYFTGFGKSRRIVLFDTLVSKLSPAELEAVLAHELGHFKLHHVLLRMAGIFAASLALFALLGWLAAQDWFFAGLGAGNAVGPHREGLALLLFAVCQPYFTSLLSPVLNALSRRQEYQADAFAVRATNAGDLERALVKLFSDNAATLTPDPVYSAFHSSHPPAPLRVAAIRAAARHD